MLVSLKMDFVKLSRHREELEKEFPEHSKEELDHLIDLNQVGTGLYKASHWDFPNLFRLRTNSYVRVEEFDSALYPEFEVPAYGVCDTVLQFLSHFRKQLRTNSEMIPPLVVGFVKISKDEQPSRNGWRWEKWGPYIGNQEPKADYLYDEPKINKVHTFNLFEVAFTEPTSQEEASHYFNQTSVNDLSEEPRNLETPQPDYFHV